MFTSILAAAAIALSALAPAHAHNGLRECDSHVRTSCVALTDEPTGRFLVRNTEGHIKHLRDGAAVLAYAKRTSLPCVDAPRHTDCFFDATTDQAADFQESFVVIHNRVWWLDNNE